MLWNAKNGTLSFPDTTMDYIRFGSGKEVLIILPGLGDGLQTVKGTALPMAWMYRLFAGNYTVYAFSRKNDLSEGYTTRDMARDLKDAMDLLRIEKAHILGVSMGGMIAQHLAIHYPEKVGKLILVVTCARSNRILTESMAEWMDCVSRSDHTALMDRNVKRIYSDRYYRQNKWLIPIMGKVTKPKSYARFLVQAQACLNHNTFADLMQIQASTLVLGGEQDKTLGGDASREIALGIPGATLKMYPEWGHGLYEEAKDFQQTVLDFLR